VHPPQKEPEIFNMATGGSSVPVLSRPFMLLAICCGSGHVRSSGPALTTAPSLEYCDPSHVLPTVAGKRKAGPFGWQAGC